VEDDARLAPEVPFEDTRLGALSFSGAPVGGNAGAPEKNRAGEDEPSLDARARAT